ncbi:MAG: DUF3540 domain-containing protein [Myxococcales bacterium]|nr:DUF3540 domain-containing protein [Myxococcales bacterium]
MSNVTVLRSERPEPAQIQPYLGPGTVETVEAGALSLRLSSGATVRAVLAMPIPYAACVGDVMLVIGNPDGHYVIGALSGTGRAVLELAGAVDVRAVGGPLRLQSDQAVLIDAPEVELRASRLRTVAEAAIQKLGSLRQLVTELWSVHAGQIHSVADGASVAQADTTAIVSRGKVTLNGKAIHLG